MNGKLFGLYVLVEQVDDTFLENRGLPLGPLYKSVHGVLSNYRHDAEASLRWAYKPMNDIADGMYATLNSLTIGLAGGAPSLGRVGFVWSAVDIYQVINQMAMQTVLHNVDRCVKNFISYYNPETARWSMIPWDMDSAFATDRLLGGQPLNDYCILACPQWNSPLFCNSEHPQELIKAWDGKSLPYGLEQTGIPEDVWRDPNSNRTAWPSLSGPAGTYNHLIDAILDVCMYGLIWRCLTICSCMQNWCL
mmetsp:Transcript_32678/g.58514  ORF Transcript_32678/g.58514 Transcript_32678/m.58514 type:complete len:249 (-) Transcript_32678:909-1655(-)